MVKYIGFSLVDFTSVVFFIQIMQVLDYILQELSVKRYLFTPESVEITLR